MYNPLPPMPPLDDKRGLEGSGSHRMFSDNRDQTATESEQGNQWPFMADFVKQLGSEIGAQIAANITPTRHTSYSTNTGIPQFSTQQPEWSKLNLVLRSDIKEPPPFRGDSADRCSGTEWQEMMQLYLNRKGYPVSEQGSEILDRLMGRAKDVVKIGIRNNPLINISPRCNLYYSETTLWRGNFLHHTFKRFLRDPATGIREWPRLLDQTE